MKLLHYVEIQNFKRFGDSQRIELGHPAVLIGPNNCGKTSAIQAIALWSQAIKTWLDAKKGGTAKERTSTAINRLNIVAVPVQRTRFFWHNTHVRTGNKDIPLMITVGVSYQDKTVPVTMIFKSKGDELVYCTPDSNTIANLELLQYAAQIRVELLYPISGLETEEPLLQSGRIDVLLGQGQTAQVLRNLCLMVLNQSKDDWQRIVKLMQRLFQVKFGEPTENTRGSIELYYQQKEVKEKLDVSSSGRGLQQVLLIFAYLYSHKGSVLLIDEPDAHLEILRQKQIYVLLRDIATENGSQIVMVTHSEVILNEAIETNLTLLIDGKVENLAKRKDISDSLKYYGAEHYIKARERGYVLYVEGGTDVDILRALAERIKHRVAEKWDERINTFYVQNNYPTQNRDAELQRVEEGFGLSAPKHFYALKQMLPDLKGLAILDNDGKSKENSDHNGLIITHWKRYEVENYFITPDVLRYYAQRHYQDMDLFSGFNQEIDTVLDRLILDRLFDGSQEDFLAWKGFDVNASRMLWDAKTANLKLSKFAEDFFNLLAQQLDGQILLSKGEFHQLIDLVDPKAISEEVIEKLDHLDVLFRDISG